MKFEYRVVRFVPSPVREEFVNVGVIAGAGADWAFQRVGNLQRASRLGGSSSVTAPFLDRVSRAIDRQLEDVEAILEAPGEKMSHGLLSDWDARMNGIIQLSPPRWILADSAEDAADMVFDLMVVDEQAVSQPRSRTVVARRAREAFAEDPAVAARLAHARQVRVEDQRVGHDVAVTTGAVVQLTQAWSFGLQNLSRLETSIQAWNYLVGRVRHHGAELVRPRSPQASRIEVPADVDVNVVYQAPRTEEGRRLLAIAQRGWDDLGIQAVPEENVRSLVVEARELIGV